MSEVIDIIHNLSYQVTDASGLDSSLKKMKQQADAIDKMKAKLIELQQYRDTAQNVQQQQHAQAAIDKTTKAINVQTQALQKQFNTNRGVQNALQTELGLIQKLTDKLNDLRQARDRQTNVAGIRQINADIAATRKQLVDLTAEGNKSSGVIAALFGGNGGSLGKQLLVGSLIGLGIGGGMGIISRAVSALIEFAAAELDTTKKAKDLADANESLKHSFEELADSIEKAKKATQENQNFEAFQYNDLRDAIDTSVSALKRKEDAVKAAGIIQGEVGNAELAQLEVANVRRQKEREEIQKQIDLYSQLHNVLDQGKYKLGNLPGLSLDGQIEQFLNTPGVPADVKAKFRADINEAGKKGGNVGDIVESMRKQMGAKAEQFTQEGANKDAEIINANKAFQAKLNEETYNKTKELNQQLLQEEENYRQLKEKGDIQSVDRIVTDTQAKYKLLYQAIYRSAVDEAKKYPGFDEKNPLGNLPTPLRDRYNTLFADNKRDQRQDTNNQTEEFLKQSSLTTLQHNAAISRGGADADKARNAFGLPSYDDLSKALDEDTAAKKQALEVEYVTTKQAFIKNGDDITQLQNEYYGPGGKLAQVDRDAYKHRLDLADEYYSKLSQKIMAASALIAEQIDTAASDRRTAIMQGRGSKEQKGRRIQRTTLTSDQQQQQNIIDAQDQQIPNLQANAGNSALALDAAKGTEGEAAAQAQYDKDAKLYEDALNKKAHANEKFAQDTQALHDIQVKQWVEAIDLTQQLADATVKSYDAIAEARQKDLDREISVRTQRVNMAEKLAERGNTTALAQEQKALDTANQQKRAAALQEQEVNAALTVSNALLAVAKAAVEGGGFASVATIAAVIAALGVGFAEAEQLNNTSKQSFKDGVINFRGKGGPRDDANQVNISSGESIMTAEATAKYSNMLEAMNKGVPVFADAPVMAPMKSMQPMQDSGTQKQLSDLNNKIDTLTDVVAGKETHVVQSVNKAGVHQIVTDQQKATRHQWRA